MDTCDRELMPSEENASGLNVPLEFMARSSEGMVNSTTIAVFKGPRGLVWA
jgi:hypothetical protein